MKEVSALPRDEASLSALVRRYCTLPDPLVSHEQLERRLHWDLEQLDPEVRRQELAVLQFWLSLQLSPAPWFRERVARLRELGDAD